MRRENEEQAVHGNLGESHDFDSFDLKQFKRASGQEHSRLIDYLQDLVESVRLVGVRLMLRDDVGKVGDDGILAEIHHRKIGDIVDHVLEDLFEVIEGEILVGCRPLALQSHLV